MNSSPCFKLRLLLNERRTHETIDAVVAFTAISAQAVFVQLLPRGGETRTGQGWKADGKFPSR